MIDMRYVPEEKTDPFVKSVKEGVNTVRSWLKPVGVGRFGLSFNWGSREIFIGVSVAKVVTETVVRRKDKKVLVKSGESRIYDL